MTDKEMVLQAYPDAHWVYLGHKINKVGVWGGQPIRVLGEGETEEAAWQNAAESLPARTRTRERSAFDEIVTPILQESLLAQPQAVTVPGEQSKEIMPKYDLASGKTTYVSGGIHYNSRAEAKSKAEQEPKPTPSTPAELCHNEDCDSNHICFQHKGHKGPCYVQPDSSSIPIRPKYRFERHGHASGRAMATFWESDILHYFSQVEALWKGLSSILDEQAIEPALKLLADVLYLWVDGYIGKASNSAAPASISNGIFDEIERFLATRNISVDYCGWSVSETQDSSSIPKKLMMELCDWLVTNFDIAETIQIGETPVKAAIRIMESQREEIRNLRGSSSISTEQTFEEWLADATITAAKLVDALAEAGEGEASAISMLADKVHIRLLQMVAAKGLK